MPTATYVDPSMLVDQSLVDSFCARADRFVNNVNDFRQRLDNMLSEVKEKFAPEMEAPAVEEPTYQEAATVTEDVAVTADDVVTADDIDIDALLQGVDLGSGMSM